MRIGIFPNLMKESSISLVQNIVSLCKENGCEYYVLYYEEESDHAVYTGIGKEHLLSGEKIYDRIELAFVLGGDGTILKSARHFASQIFWPDGTLKKNELCWPVSWNTQTA